MPVHVLHPGRVLFVEPETDLLTLIALWFLFPSQLHVLDHLSKLKGYSQKNAVCKQRVTERFLSTNSLNEKMFGMM